MVDAALRAVRAGSGDAIATSMAILDVADALWGEFPTLWVIDGSC